MRILILALALSFPLAVAAAAPKGPTVQQFNSEEQARIHCPYDVIVWVNPHQRLWYPHNSKHYANDGVGGFACKEEAVKARYKQGK